MASLREKIAAEIRQAEITVHAGGDGHETYAEAEFDDPEATADRILAIPEIRDALAMCGLP